jgi:hypothetical protein
MGKNKSNDSRRRKFWQMTMESRQTSGLSVAAFCKQEGISEAAYYYWRKKLSAAAAKPKEASASTFLEVSLPQSQALVLELVLSSGHTLRIPPGADHKTLSQVLSVLRGAELC